MIEFTRAYPLEDITIRSGGDGRTVEAYAAVFNVPQRIVDGSGQYMEVIDRAALIRRWPIRARALVCFTTTVAQSGAHHRTRTQCPLVRRKPLSLMSVGC